MANHKSAVKRNKQSSKRNLRNRAAKSKMKTIIKNCEQLIASGDKEEAQKSFVLAQKAIAMSAQKGFLKKNAASRYVSRLAIQINK